MYCGEAFRILKPTCDAVALKATKKNLGDLVELFDRVPPLALQQLQDYILYPLELSLKRPDIKSEIKRCILDCMRKLISCVEINDVSKLLYLYSLVFVQVFDKNAANMVANVSEELKLSVVKCATELLNKTAEEVITQLYSKAVIPKICQGIFICVQLMQNEKLHSLRVAAIEFLLYITQLNDGSKLNTVYRPIIADTITFVVPGMLSGLYRVITGDVKQGHMITLMAIRAWSRLLTLVLEDIQIESKSGINFHFKAKITDCRTHDEIKNKTVSSKFGSEDREAMMTAIKSQTRSEEWAKSVVHNINTMAKSFKTLQYHDHWKVRMELAEACYLLVSRCHRHLRETSVIFVEILLNLSDDETREIVVKCEEAMKEITQILEEKHGVILFEDLEENFYRVITEMPRIFHVESDDEKLSVLRLLKGYLKLLSTNRLKEILHCIAHLERIVQVLLQVVELEYCGISLLEEGCLRELELGQFLGLHRPWKQFKHFRDKKILEKIEEICKLLGEYGDLEVFCHYFLDLFSDKFAHRNEVILIINEIVLGVSGSDNDKEQLIKNILDVYLDTKVWYVPLLVNDDKDEPVTLGQVRSNLVLSCLLVEGIGKAASSMGSNFRFFLMRVMYIVVERAGSPHSLLATAGLHAARDIAIAVNQGSDITSLLAANMDYFMVQVVIKLRNVHSNPGVLYVLSVVMKHSDKDMILHLQNVVSDVLLKSSDTFQFHHPSSFLQVFCTYFHCIKKWFPPTLCQKASKVAPTKRHDAASVVKTLIEYHKNIQLSSYEKMMENSENFEKEEMLENTETLDNTECVEDLSYEEEDKKPVPPYIEMTVSILNRCLHLLPSKDKHCKLLALETIQEGVQILSDWEDQLLPVVHNVWSPLVGRLQDSEEALILNRGFQLLCTLATLAKDFIRSRTLKQVMPALRKFLINSAAHSKQKGTCSTLRFTQSFKMQAELLLKLGDFAVDLQLQEKELDQLVNACAPYLSCLQPTVFQNCCVELFKRLAEYDRDIVWLEMMKLEQEGREYKENIELIREFLRIFDAT